MRDEDDVNQFRTRSIRRHDIRRLVSRDAADRYSMHEHDMMENDPMVSSHPKVRSQDCRFQARSAVHPVRPDSASACWLSGGCREYIKKSKTVSSQGILVDLLLLVHAQLTGTHVD